jgi:hypothetical protein
MNSVDKHLVPVNKSSYFLVFFRVYLSILNFLFHFLFNGKDFVVIGVVLNPVRTGQVFLALHVFSNIIQGILILDVFQVVLLFSKHSHKEIVNNLLD